MLVAGKVGAVIGVMLALPATAEAAARRMETREIRATAEHFVASQARPGVAVQAVADRLDERLALPACVGELTPYLAPGAVVRPRTSVGVRCPDPGGWSVFVPVTESRMTTRNDLAPPASSAGADGGGIDKTSTDVTKMDAWFSNAQKVNVDTLGKKYVLTDYGVKTDSTLIQTKAIQAVIDRAAQDGGGVIVVPTGTYQSGALFASAQESNDRTEQNQHSPDPDEVDQRLPGNIENQLLGCSLNQAGDGDSDRPLISHDPI